MKVRSTRDIAERIKTEDAALKLAEKEEPGDTYLPELINKVVQQLSVEMWNQILAIIPDADKRAALEKRLSERFGDTEGLFDAYLNLLEAPTPEDVHRRADAFQENFAGILSEKEIQSVCIALNNNMPKYIQMLDAKMMNIALRKNTMREEAKKRLSVLITGDIDEVNLHEIDDILSTAGIDDPELHASIKKNKEAEERVRQEKLAKAEEERIRKEEEDRRKKEREDAEKRKQEKKTKPKTKEEKQLEEGARMLDKNGRELMQKFLLAGAADIAFTMLSSGKVSQNGATVEAEIEGARLIASQEGEDLKISVGTNDETIDIPLSTSLPAAFDAARAETEAESAQVQMLATMSAEKQAKLLHALGGIDIQDERFMKQDEATYIKLFLHTILSKMSTAADEVSALKELGILNRDNSVNLARSNWFRLYFRSLGRSGVQLLDTADLKALASRWNSNKQFSLPSIDELRTSEKNPF